MKPHHTYLRRSLMIALVGCLSLISSVEAAWEINRPGSYKLSRSFSVAEGDGIVITASGVTLDLSGHQVSTNKKGTGRGIAIVGAKSVTVKNGGVTGFNANIALDGAEGSQITELKITGDNLAPNNGPSEIGVLIINSFGNVIDHNTISSTNLGIFVRGGKSSGNRIIKNVLTGGKIAANNLLGICYNPAPTPAGQTSNPAGPRGDSIYSNQIARYNYALAVSTGSISNMFNDNTLASFTGAFREPQNFAAQGGTNVEFDNTSVIIPNENL
jgi:parallel beta-helix repeat protein